MSDIIQPRHYTARQATLLQQRPGDLIEAAEDGAAALEGGYSRAVYTVYDHAVHVGTYNIVGSGVAGTGRGFVSALTAGTKVMLVNTSWPTTSPELLVDLDEYQAESSWTRWAGQAKEALQNAASTARRQTTAAARWRVERLSALQAAFGFTIQDLAAVLGITRPQLYKWLDNANDIKLHEASRVRVAIVERIAKEWTSRSNAPLSSVSREPLNGGGTVFAMLSVEAINEAAVTAAFNELADKLEKHPKTRSERLREAGFTRRPSARALPSDE